MLLVPVIAIVFVVAFVAIGRNGDDDEMHTHQAGNLVERCNADELGMQIHLLQIHGVTAGDQKSCNGTGHHQGE